MKQPLGFRDPTNPNHVCLLQGSLYDLKQALEVGLTTLLTLSYVSSRTTDASCPYSYTNKVLIWLFCYYVLMVSSSPLHQMSYFAKSCISWPLRSL